MTIYEKAVAELHRQGLTSAGIINDEVYIEAWLDDLECTIDITVHDEQVKVLAEKYEKSEDYVNLPFIWK